MSSRIGTSGALPFSMKDEKKIAPSHKTNQKVASCAAKCIKGTACCGTISLLLLAATMSILLLTPQTDECNNHLYNTDGAFYERLSVERQKLEKLSKDVENFRLKEGPPLGRYKHRLKSLRKKLFILQFERNLRVLQGTRGSHSMDCPPVDFCPLPNTTSAHCMRMNKQEIALEKKIEAILSKMWVAELGPTPKPQPKSRRLQKLEWRLEWQSHRIKGMKDSSLARYTACKKAKA